MRQQKAGREKAEQKASELAELDQLMREEAEFEAVRGGGVRASTSPESSSAPASASAPSTAAVSSGASLYDKGLVRLLFRLITSRVFYGVSCQKGLWETCLFLLFAHFERNKSMDFYSISGQKWCLENSIFSVYLCSF